MTDIKNNRRGSWAPLPGVPNLNFSGYPIRWPFRVLAAVGLQRQSVENPLLD
jgi:hypothetical protein